MFAASGPMVIEPVTVTMRSAPFETSHCAGTLPLSSTQTGPSVMKLPELPLATVMTITVAPAAHPAGGGPASDAPLPSIVDASAGLVALDVDDDVVVTTVLLVLCVPELVDTTPLVLLLVDDVFPGELLVDDVLLLELLPVSTVDELCDAMTCCPVFATSPASAEQATIKTLGAKNRACLTYRWMRMTKAFPRGGATRTTHESAPVMALVW
jgi:hypothetical protein